MPIIAAMEALVKPRRGLAAIRLLAAALAGAIGAFGMPAAAHRAQPAPRPGTSAAATVVNESRPD